MLLIIYYFRIPNSALPLKHNSYFGSVPPNLDVSYEEQY